jgi:hypothetical protein
VTGLATLASASVLLHANSGLQAASHPGGAANRPGVVVLVHTVGPTSVAEREALNAMDDHQLMAGGRLTEMGSSGLPGEWFTPLRSTPALDRAIATHPGAPGSIQRDVALPGYPGAAVTIETLPSAQAYENGDHRGCGNPFCRADRHWMDLSLRHRIDDARTVRNAAAGATGAAAGATAIAGVVLIRRRQH